jgi:hypothetical protein
MHPDLLAQDSKASTPALLTAALALACLAAPRSAHADATPRTWRDALFVETSVAFIPYANDLAPMLGGGVRFAKIHEVWARGGYIPVGDDMGLGFGVGGYRAVLRPLRVVRPFFGGLVAGLPQTCTHDSLGHQTCTRDVLFIFAATAGVRFEPAAWFGVSASLSLGLDSYPNPFGMVELGVSFALPLD